MVLPHFKPDDFFNFLGDNQWILGTSEYKNQGVLIFNRGSEELLVPIKNTYWFLYVVRICEDFEMTPPKDFTKVHMQLKKMQQIARKRTQN